MPRPRSPGRLSSLALALALTPSALAPPQTLAAETLPAEVDLAGADVAVRPGAANLERFAARELARYLRLLSGKVSAVTEARDLAEVRARGRTAIFLDARSGPRDRLPPERRGDPEAYAIAFEPAAGGSPPVLSIRSETPIGVQHAVYGLLERLGVGFYLGGDALPERRERLALPGDLSEARAPAFRIRGSLPWYNFLNSPTTWDLEDYQHFFDQMAKMRCNFVGFHSYDSEPFCAYPEGGAWRLGEPAATSKTYGWGTVRHLRSDEFGFGTGRFFPHEVFGSRSAALARDPPEGAKAPERFPLKDARDDAIVRAQCVLAQGLEYAKRRGLKVCLGFELTGDPTSEENRRSAEARIRNLLASYPMLDYVWFWQSEGLGGGSQAPERDSPLDRIVERHRPTFAYLGSEGRIAEAARIGAWVEYAHGVVRSLRPEVRVIVSGWGGDAWMRFSDFYAGLDRILPEDVIFAALDNIDPTAQPHVSEVYGKLSPSRERWPIPWFESDGGGTRRDQWGPQTNVRPFVELARDALRKGCQGILGIHWQTRGVEEVAAWTAQFAWDPELTYERFYERLARASFGERHGAELAQVLRRLESFGPRWTGGAGQVECGGFEWFSDARRPTEERFRALEEIDARLATIERDFRSGPGLHHLERLRYLRATIAFLVAYDRAALDLAPGGRVAALVDEAEAAAARGERDEGARRAREAIEALDRSSLGPAMAAYAERLTTQGDFGNLATINVKAYAAWLGLRERAVRALGAEAPDPPARASPPAALGVDEGAPRLVLKSPPSALPEGAPFRVRAVAFAENGSVEVRLRWRAPGAPAWKESAMAREERHLFSAEIPGEDVGPEGVEWWVEARGVDGRTAAAPAGWPETRFGASAIPGFARKAYEPRLDAEFAFAPWGGAPKPRYVRTAILSPREYEAFELSASSGGRPFGRAVSAYHLGAVAVPEDLLGRPALECILAAAKEGWRVAAPAARFAKPPPPPAPASVRAEVAGPFHVRVSWDAPPALFEVHRSKVPGFQPGPETLVARWPWRVYDDVGVEPRARYEYAVVAAGAAGDRSPAARSPVLEIGDFPLPPPPANLRARPGFGRVALSWDAPAERVSGFAVFRATAEGWVRAGGEEPIRGTEATIAGLPEGEPCRFAVRSIDRAGRLGELSSDVSATPLAVPAGPVFEAAFDSTRAATGGEGRLAGKAKVRDGVLDVSEGGWIEYPGSELLQVGGPISIELWARVRRIEGIPVLLAFGHWEGPGYWLQLIGGKIRFYLPVQKHLDAGSLSTGAWHHIAATYDGTTSRLYVDGDEVGRAAIGSVSLEPWRGPLRIGMYSDIDAQYQTLGELDDVRIFQRALSKEEVRRSFEAGRAAR